MFEQENLQGWNISHIVSSWHCGPGEENAAIALSLVFECKSGKVLWKKKTVMKTGRGLGEEKDPWRMVNLFPDEEDGIY